MPLYEIWSEGYRASGDEPGDAHLHGMMEGATFAEACRQFTAQHPTFAKYFDADRMTYWACRLFDNEPAARRTFG